MGLIFFWFQTLGLAEKPMVLVWSFAEVFFLMKVDHFLEARRILSDLSLAKYDEVNKYIHTYIYIYINTPPKTKMRMEHHGKSPF